MSVNAGEVVLQLYTASQSLATEEPQVSGFLGDYSKSEPKSERYPEQFLFSGTTANHIFLYYSRAGPIATLARFFDTKQCCKGDKQWHNTSPYEKGKEKTMKTQRTSNRETAITAPVQAQEPAMPPLIAGSGIQVMLASKRQSALR